MKIITFDQISWAIASTMLLLSLQSCDEGGDPDPGATATIEFSGDWYLSVYDAEGNDLTGYSLFSTYNTAANDNTLWIDDHESIFPLKVKVNADLNALTFSKENADNEYDSNAVATITEGKVIKKGGKATGSQTIVDSLSFKIVLANDPGPYIVAGHKRTGFLEDEH